MAKLKPWSKDVWKVVAIIALAAAVIQACVGIYVVLAFKSNIDVISSGTPICLAGMRDYDSIAAAQAIGRLDLVSFLLTTGGVLLGVFSLIGFWIIRREAMEEAREAALSEAQKFLSRFDVEGNGKGTYIEDGRAPSQNAINAKRGKIAALNIPKFEEVSTVGAVREEPGESDDDTERGA